MELTTSSCPARLPPLRDRCIPFLSSVTEASCLFSKFAFFHVIPTMSSALSPPTKYAVALFDGFQSLDVFGPLDALNYLSKSTPLELSLLGPTLKPVSTLHNPGPGRIGQHLVPTHTYAEAPTDIEVLLVPGGLGTRDAAHTQVVVDFVRERFPSLRYLLTVCTGSALAARAGVLDGREATTNKLSFDWVS